MFSKLFNKFSSGVSSVFNRKFLSTDASNVDAIENDDLDNDSGYPISASQRLQPYVDSQGKKVYRSLQRRDISPGRVIKHIPGGILVQLPGGEVGMVTDVELDWSPRIGRKHFPVGMQLTVMVLSRPTNKSLFLSIREPKFAEYFKSSCQRIKIGDICMCSIKSVKDYGFFVQLYPRVDLFFHHSELITDLAKFKAGDLIEIKITGFDFEHLKVLGEIL